MEPIHKTCPQGHTYIGYPGICDSGSCGDLLSECPQCKIESGDIRIIDREEKLTTPHFNNLTPAEAERLAILSEECGEAIQIIGKILRHGYDLCHPNDLLTTNRELLEKELGHVIYMIQEMSHRDDISMQSVQRHTLDKRRSVVTYLHHQDET